jgi:hypothetical protein
MRSALELVVLAAALGCSAPAVERSFRSSAAEGAARLSVRFVDESDGSPVACHWLIFSDGSAGEIEGVGTACDVVLSPGPWILRVRPLDGVAREREMAFELGPQDRRTEDVEISWSD